MKSLWSLAATGLYRMGWRMAIPTNIGICVTPHCNIRCKYCMRQQFTPPGEPMTMDTLKTILNRMPYVSGVCIMGLCEPYLNQHLSDMLWYLGNKGYSISLTTNGMVPIKDMKALRNVGSFVISVDTADPETFAYLREGAKLDVVMSRLNEVIAFKHENGLGKFDNPPIHINAVITKHNIHQIPDLIKMFEPYADDLTYLMIDPISRPDYQTFEKPMALTIGEYTNLINEYRELAERSPLNIIGFDYMLKHSFDWNKCALAWFGPFIEPNGDMYFCYDYRRVVGNVFKDNPLKAWNSPVARAFRKELRSHFPPLEQCRCCNFARQNWQPGGAYDQQGEDRKDVET